MKHLVLIAIMSMAAIQFAHAQYTFGPQVRTTPLANITYNSGTGVFQYTDAANPTTDDAQLPLTGSAASIVTTSNGWTATLTPDLPAKTMGVGKVTMHLILTSGSNSVLISLAQHNDSGTTNESVPTNFYGTSTQFIAANSNGNVATTPLGNSLTFNGASYLVLSGGTATTLATESLAAVAGTIGLSYNAATNTVTGYYNGTPIGSFSLASWGSNPPLTLYVQGESKAVKIAAGSDTATNFNVTSGEPTDVSSYSIEKEVNYNQSSASAPALDPVSPYQFFSNINPGTSGALFTSATTLTPPSPGTGTVSFLTGANNSGPNSSSSPNALYFSENFASKAALDAAFPSGASPYGFSIQTTAPNSYTDQLSLGTDNYPANPEITGVTNATWSGGHLVVTDITQPVVITWSNPPGTGGAFLYISNTGVNSGNDPNTTANSFTLPGGSLSKNTYYNAALFWSNGGGTGSTDSGTIPGASGAVTFAAQVTFDIQTGTPVGSTSTSSIEKQHFLVQTANSAPVDATGDANDFYSGGNFAPYSIWMISATSGTVTGPGNTSFPLASEPDNGNKSQGDYEFLSGPEASQADLDTAYPDGTYTLPDGVQVSLTGDGYPTVPQILAVNGLTPVWDGQGHLVLNPAISNTITWSPVTVPNFATNGSETANFFSLGSDNFNSIEIKAGASRTSTTAFTTLTIPANIMTAGNVYNGFVQYGAFPSVNHPSATVYNVAGYKTETEFSAIAAYPAIGLSQTIAFPAIANQIMGAAPFTLSATASSGLAVTYSVVSGPATLSGPNNDTVTLTGVGTVVIEASQTGNGTYGPAANMTKSFTVIPGTAIVMLDGLGVTYDDAPQSVTATTNPSGLDVTFTYNGKATLPVAAGSYAVVGTVDSPNYHGSAKGELVIGKAAATVNFGNLTFYYNGLAHPATATTSPTGFDVTFTYNGKATVPVELGSYTVVGTIDNADYAGSATGTLTISVAPPMIYLGASGAEVTQGVFPNGVATSIYFEYSTSSDFSSYLSTAVQSLGSGKVPVNVYALFPGLTPAMPYYYRIVTTTAAGAVVGTTETFTTLGFDTTLVAQKGAFAVGTNGPTFATFGNPAVNIDDDVAFAGTLTLATGTITAANDTGIWIDDSGTRQLIAQIGIAGGAPLATGSGTFLTLGDPVCNNSGAVAFRGTLKVVTGEATATTATGIWAGDSAADLALVARQGGLAPGANGGTFATFTSLGLSDSGGAVLYATLNASKTPVITAANDSGIWEGSTVDNLALVLQLGGTAGGKTITKLTFLPAETYVNGQTRGFDSATGDIVCGATFSDKTTGVVTVIGGTASIAAQSGSPAAEVTGATYASFGNPAINTNHDIAFEATLATAAGVVTTSDNLGVWAVDNTGTLQLIARSGLTGAGEAPGTTASFLAFSDPVYNNKEAVAFRATLKVATGQATATTATGVWATNGSPGSLALVAQQGSQATGCPAGATFATFTELALADQGGATNQGGVIMLATLNASATAGVSAANNLGIWAVDNTGTLQLIVRTGDILNGKTVTGLAFLPNLTYVNGQGRSFAQGNGDLVYLATFSDKSTAIFNVVFP